MLYSRSRFSWGLSEIGATKPDGARLLREAPAAFGRLCVETCGLPLHRHPEIPAAFGRLCVETNAWTAPTKTRQPAAFGRLCVETFIASWLLTVSTPQPPSGGCVLKLGNAASRRKRVIQPPSGGCVLKPMYKKFIVIIIGTSRLRAAVC